MWEYIVLGQIPGTQIQVNFEAWLLAIAGLLLSGLVLLAARSSYNRHLVLAIRISRIIQTSAYAHWLLTRRHIRA